MPTQTTRYEDSVTEEIYRSYNYPWGPNQQTKFVTQWLFSRTDNDPEKRPYPTDMFYGMTSQLMQSKTLQETGYQHEIADGGYYTIDIREWQLPSAVIPASTLCPWPEYENQLRNKIKEEAVNLGASLAEYRQTCNMFVDLAKGLVHGMRRIRQGFSPFHEKIDWKDVPSSWLMIRFGVDPLVNDIEASLKKLDNLNKAGFLKRFTVKAKDSLSSSGLGNVALDWSEDEVSIRAVCWVKFDENPANFTLGNPAELAWELTPYSWLIDYVIGIGDYLSALDALSEVAELRGTVTKKRKYTSGTNMKDLGPLPNAQNSYEGKHVYESHQRDLYTWLPMGKIEFKQSISGGKIANAVAALLLLR